MKKILSLFAVMLVSMPLFVGLVFADPAADRAVLQERLEGIKKEYAQAAQDFNTAKQRMENYAVEGYLVQQQIQALSTAATETLGPRKGK